MTEPSESRLLELVQTVIDPHAVLGPLDRDDLSQALVELVARRNAEVIMQPELALVERRAATVSGEPK